MDPVSYFQLKEAPFRISPDPTFLYLSDQVTEAIAKCEFMARQRIGPVYIYGPIGAGKTSLMRRMYERFHADEQFTVASFITPPVKTSNAFLRIIMDAFDVKTERAYDQSLKNFEQFLIELLNAGVIPLLLIDEAQNMTRDMLKLIHYLLNFETNEVKLLQIVLAGQEELATKILRYRELASRMFPTAINAMSPKELAEMISYRWIVAGGTETPFIDQEVFNTIFTYSKGLPRDAVKICDEVLRHIIAKGERTATVEEIEQVAKGLNLTAKS